MPSHGHIGAKWIRSYRHAQRFQLQVPGPTTRRGSIWPSLIHLTFDRHRFQPCQCPAYGGQGSG